MGNIIRELSKNISKEIISRPKFDFEEITEIINFRIKESLLDILLENAEKEEITYTKLLIQQSNFKVGSKQYVEFGYKLAVAKKKKAIANRAVNNTKNVNKIGITINYIKEKYKDFDLESLYKLWDESEVQNG